MSRLSVVLPAYNEEQMLAKTCRTLKKILDLAEINYELVIVDDGSTDQTWKIIEETAEKDRNVTGVHFSRNFGKEAAIVAGLAQASGNAVAVMDCDLQHPPEVLVKMYRLWEQGYEVVEGIKKSRGTETVFHRKSAGFFYRIMSRATGFNMENASDFKLLDRKAFFLCQSGACFFGQPHPGLDLKVHLCFLRCRSGKQESLNGLPEA